MKIVRTGECGAVWRCPHSDHNLPSCVSIDVGTGTAVATKGAEPKSFTYDAVYDNTARQLDIYDETVRPIVADVLNG